MNAAAVAIFMLTYALIASRRLAWLPIGRPAGALVGAVAMVAVGVLTPAESYRAIDHDTIVLLFGMMVLTVHLEDAGFFTWLAGHWTAKAVTPWRMLASLSLLAALLSAWLVNDTVCLFLTPVVVATCRRTGLPFGPYLIALATSANIGSAATLVGNPQNMMIGSMSDLPFAWFLLRAGPAALAGVALNVGLLWLYYGRRLPASMPPAPPAAPPADPRRLTLVVTILGLAIAGFLAGFHLGYTTLAAVVVLVLIDRRDPRDIFARVDWSLLLFFCCLFIVVAGLAKTGLHTRAWEAGTPWFNLHRASGLAWFAALLTVGSNLVSNVPMVLLTGPSLPQLGSPELGWVLLAFVTTVAGNFTLIGSVANIIVAEGARNDYTLGFREYLRFGVVSTLAVLVVGVAIISFSVK